MADLRIVDAPVLLQESITGDVKIPTGGLGNYALRLGDLVWYVVAKENLASKSYVDTSSKGVQDKLDNLKADKATTLSGYGIADAYNKNETYSKTEINTSLSSKASVNYVDSKDGDLTTLKTVNKTTLVQAVNEVFDNSKGVVDLYAKNIAAGAGANGWTATLVADESGMNQQQINDKTAIFYNNVADMVADTNLKAGKAVITHGYYTHNDGGGARYLISSTATDYSIPVANNLHAVFADSFDIRKFGIRNSATLDQTTEIKRMVGYADTRVYEIDFLNFSLMTPKTWTVMAYKSVMGLTFLQAHKIKNLFIAHDKTKRLETGHNLINFLPIKNPDFEIYFALENVTFDPWHSNYQPLTENYLGWYDGMRHGLFCHPHKDSDIPQWGHTPSNYSFSFKNVRFSSPAYSYNLTTSAVFSKNTYVENVDGEFLGLYLNFHTKNLHVENMHGLQRGDYLEAGRLMVRNLLHYEAELGAVGDVVFDSVYVENASCYSIPSSGSIADKEIWSVFKWSNIGSGNIINKATFINVDGTNVIEKIAVNEVTYKDSKRMSFNLYKSTNTSDNLPNITIDNCNIYGDQTTFGTVVFLARQPLNKLEISNSTFYTAICVNGGQSSINKLTLKNVEFKGELEYAIGRGAYTIKELNMDGVTVFDKSMIYSMSVENTIANNVRLINTSDDKTKPVGSVFVNSNSASTLVLSKLHIDYKQQAAWTYIFEGFYSVLLTNSILFLPSVDKLNVANYKQSNVIPEPVAVVTFDPPSLATSTQQSTTVTLTGAKLGDTVSAAFNQPLQGTRMWGEVTANNQVTVYHRNDTGVAVDLPSGTLTVKII